MKFVDVLSFKLQGITTIILSSFHLFSLTLLNGEHLHQMCYATEINLVFDTFKLHCCTYQSSLSKLLLHMFLSVVPENGSNCILSVFLKLIGIKTIHNYFLITQELMQLVVAKAPPTDLGEEV